MVYVPGTMVFRDCWLVHSDVPGVGIEATLDWLQQRIV